MTKASQVSEMVAMLIECDLNYGAWERVDILRSAKSEGSEHCQLAGVDCMPSVEVYDECPVTVRVA